MSDSKSSDSLSNHIKPLNESKWGDSVDAMHNYLTLLKKHAEMKTEVAEGQLAEHEKDLKNLKQQRSIRRNYGTHTGIALQAKTEDEEAGATD